jgi:uncharacterized protein
VIYLDSSALLKLLFEERESAALEAWLTDHPAPVLSSELAKVEVVRAARRLDPDPDAVSTARRLVTQLDLVPLSADVLEAAADIGDPLLRSLDALHLASASAVGTPLMAFVAYDRRLTAAGRNLGLPVAHPGAT